MSLDGRESLVELVQGLALVDLAKVPWRLAEAAHVHVQCGREDEACAVHVKHHLLFAWVWHCGFQFSAKRGSVFWLHGLESLVPHRREWIDVLDGRRGWGFAVGSCDREEPLFVVVLVIVGFHLGEWRSWCLGPHACLAAEGLAISWAFVVAPLESALGMHEDAASQAPVVPGGAWVLAVGGQARDDHGPRLFLLSFAGAVAVKLVRVLAALEFGVVAADGVDPARAKPVLALNEREGARSHRALEVIALFGFGCFLCFAFRAAEEVFAVVGVKVGYPGAHRMNHFGAAGVSVPVGAGGEVDE